MQGAVEQHGLLRAGSWQPPEAGVLLKTASDVVQMLQQNAKHAHHHRLAADGGDGKTNSVDSSSTAAGRQPSTLLLDSATAGLLPPLRQISLDVIAATELNRVKGLAPTERQSSIFQDVFEQLTGKDDLPPLQAGQLYTLPSMQFLESMLSDFDRTATGGGGAPPLHGPLDLPGDAFDLPEFAGGLRPTPFDQQHAHAQPQPHPHAYYAQPAPAYSGFVPMGGSAPAALAPSGVSSSGSMTLQASLRAHSAYEASRLSHGGGSAPHRAHAAALMAAEQRAAAARPPAVRGPAVPQPAQPRATPRRASQAYADFDYEEAEVSLQTSKSGRVRKVASFTGVKRRLDVTGGNTASESRDSRGSVGADVSSGEVGSRGSKGARKPAAGGPKSRKGRRTVCCNCGCTQTPQWRCGPLGPRTLCNACGVRYKKDLPLNCWPIRDGMVLPPGAVLPAGFVCPPGITIHTQPAEFE